ncbi:hypothetical protein GWI33_006541, partial [Rhynchophorus ferrugineus]
RNFPLENTISPPPPPIRHRRPDCRGTELKRNHRRFDRTAIWPNKSHRRLESRYLQFGPANPNIKIFPPLNVRGNTCRADGKSSLLPSKLRWKTRNEEGDARLLERSTRKEEEEEEDDEKKIYRPRARHKLPLGYVIQKI